jgi:two-component system response regulator FixJ
MPPDRLIPDLLAPDLLAHVIDDDEAVRESLAFLLETDGLPVRTYESAEVFLSAMSGAPVAGCLITDVRMPGLTGLELVRRLRELAVDLPVVMITGHADVPMAVEAMKAGVVDFIEKPFEDDALLGVVRRTLEAQGRAGEREAERADVTRRLATLTGRESEVFDRLVLGAANKVIANDLGISPRTVEIYRANVMSKMAARNLSELVRMGLLAAPRNS